MSTLKEKLEHCVKDWQTRNGRKFKKKDLIDYVTVGKSTVMLWFNGTTKELSGTSLVEVARYFGVSEDYLAGKSNRKNNPTKQTVNPDNSSKQERDAGHNYNQGQDDTLNPQVLIEVFTFINQNMPDFCDRTVESQATLFEMFYRKSK